MTKTIHPLSSNYLSTKWGLERGALIQGGTYFKSWLIGGALTGIRRGHLFEGGVIIRGFTATTFER